MKKSNFLEESELTATLDMFVQFGILLKTNKNGEDAWVENPEFNKKSKKEQAKVFKQLEQSSDIPNQVLESLMNSNASDEVAH